MAYGAPSGRIANKHGKSYEYRCRCDSCGFVYWNYELRLRWDGLWCCPDDWEIRHPVDFYRSRNDTHKLPFIRSQEPADNTITFTPNSGITINNVDGETGTEQKAYYYVDLNGYTWLGWLILFTKPSFSNPAFAITVNYPKSTTSSTPGNFNTPTPVLTHYDITVTNSNGFTTTTSGGATSNIILPSWTKVQGNLQITGKYI